VDEDSHLGAVFLNEVTAASFLRVGTATATAKSGVGSCVATTRSTPDGN
jgi:hypothetical protein